jgi:hypothetical protein
MKGILGGRTVERKVGRRGENNGENSGMNGGRQGSHTETEGGIQTRTLKLDFPTFDGSDPGNRFSRLSNSSTTTALQITKRFPLQLSTWKEEPSHVITG